MDRKCKELNKLLGIDKDGTIVVVAELFKYNDSNMQGATFHMFEKMNDEIIKQRKGDYDWKEQWQMAVASGNYEGSLKDYEEENEDEDENYYDSSYSNKSWYDEIVKQVCESGLDDFDDIEFMDATGGGRSWNKEMLDDDYWQWKSPEFDELVRQIQEYEKE